MRQKRKYRNFISIFIIIAICLVSCGKKAVSEEDKIECPEAGLVFQIPEEYREKGIEVEGPFEDYEGNICVSVSWYYKPVTDKLFADIMSLSQESLTEKVLVEFYEKMGTHSKALMNITLIEEQKFKNAIDSGKDISELSYWNPVEKLGENDGYVYLVSIPENNTTGMEQEEKELYKECSAYMQTVKKTISFIKTTIKEGFPTQMPAFTTKDLDGNTVTESIFTEKDLNVVNIWGTFCNPCIEEMPELGEWAKNMPDNVQLIGLVSDISDENDTKHYDLAVTIMERANADFLQIIANDDFNSIMKWVTGVPTTIFVDKEGNIVGKIVGADVEGYKSFVEEYLNGQ